MAATTGSAVDGFHAAHGDPWDRQKDIALAVVGAAMALIALLRTHDHQLAALYEALEKPAATPKIRA